MSLVSDGREVLRSQGFINIGVQDEAAEGPAEKWISEPLSEKSTSTLAA